MSFLVHARPYWQTVRCRNGQSLDTHSSSAQKLSILCVNVQPSLAHAWPYWQRLGLALDMPVLMLID